MPKKPIDYSNCCINKIEHIEKEDLVYVGHTTNFTKRKNCHKSNCKNELSSKHNYKLYQMIRDNEGWDSFRMVEVEKFPCNDKREAEKRETEVMKELKTNMNTYKSFTNKKEYSEKNKEKINEQKKLHYELNTIKIKEYQKEYRNKNKELIKERRKESDKKYMMKNKDKIKEYIKINKDRIKERGVEYYKTNKDKVKERCKEYRNKNKELIKERRKEYDRKYLEKKKIKETTP